MSDSRTLGEAVADLEEWEVEPDPLDRIAEALERIASALEVRL